MDPTNQRRNPQSQSLTTGTMTRPSTPLPRHLGIETAGGVMTKLVTRGTAIPAKKTPLRLCLVF